MRLEKVENESEKKTLLALTKKQTLGSYSDVARAVGISKPWAKKIITKFVDMGIIANKNSIYSLNANRIATKTLLAEVLKDTITLPLIGMAICLSTAIVFNEYAMLPIIGGLEVFLPQFLYTLYKVLVIKEDETIDIFLKVK